MKQFFTISLLLIAANLFAQSKEEKLMNTVKAFHQALIDKNIISINQQTDKALSYGHSNGWVQSKTDLIKDFEKGLIDYKSISEDSLTITLNGNLANVRFVSDITAVYKGTTSNFKLKVLEVWMKKGKRWILFARQAIKN
ncbi:MAG: nuclear transport factor 2 family protein [Ferruginibacter sp.]|nr:nuclear transport factor 2 family protein [Bacteroidota bacterium]MBX2920341.1 nuclear transport factor 2 family protein [Ferruginibacter sp.]MCB0709840.1 nuclear transport factor 2 family protein [Chitinophagaceae bacterium]